jgi:putative transposase
VEGHGFNRAETREDASAVLTAEGRMATPGRSTNESGTYFVTSRSWESRALFIKEPACEIVLEPLLHYRSEGKYRLHSFVLMPDHFHLILTPGTDTTLERALQLIKGGSSRKISQALTFHFPVWQRSFTDHRIRDGRDYEAHVRYIEENPVKAGFVQQANQYRWSSANGKFVLDQPPQGLKPPEHHDGVGTVKTVPLRSDMTRGKNEIYPR